VCEGEKTMSGSHPISPLYLNKTGTLHGLPVAVTAESACDLRGDFEGRQASDRPRCGYVVAATWRYGAPDPFCDAPALPGSSYCAAHRALCAVDPATEEGRRLASRQAAAAQAALPDAFPPLVAPEPPPETEPEEALGEIHVPAADDDRA
jgi:hypothetical protein